MSEPLDLKKLLQEFNEIPDNPIHVESSKNNSSNPNSNNIKPKNQPGKFKPLIETSSSWASQYLSPGVYQMKHPKDEEGDNDGGGNNNPREPKQPRNKNEKKPTGTPSQPSKNPTSETTPDWEPAPIDTSKPVEPQNNPLPDWNIEFDGNFTDAEKRTIVSLPSSKWKPAFKKELLASKEDLIKGFNENPEFIVRTVDENTKAGHIPYRLLDKLFKRTRESTLNINNSDAKFIVMVPKNDNDIIESSGYGDDDALVKINDHEKLHIIKLNKDMYNVMFSANKPNSVNQVEETLRKPTQTPKPTSNQGLVMVDEDEEVKPEVKVEPKKETSKPTSKPTYKMADEDAVEKVKSKKLKISPEKKADIKANKPVDKLTKSVGKQKLRMVDEMPEPQEVVGKNIIVRTKETGNKDIKVRVNSYDTNTDKFNINYNGANWKGIPVEFIKNGFIRMAAK